MRDLSLFCGVLGQNARPLVTLASLRPHLLKPLCKAMSFWSPDDPLLAGLIGCLAGFCWTVAGMRAQQASRLLALAALLLRACLAAAQSGDPPTFDMSATMSALLANKAATVEQQQTQLQTQLDAAAKVAEDLAKQAPWKPPPTPKGGTLPGSYLDLSQPEPPAPEEKAFVYDSTVAR